MATKRADGCEPLEGVVGGIAKKLGGELLRNEDGVFVLRMGGTETIFPSEEAAADHLSRVVTAARQNAEAHSTINSAVTAAEKRAGVTDKEMRAALDEAAKFPVEDIPAQMDFAKSLSGEVGEPLQIGGEQAPAMIRGGLMKGNKFGFYFMRQHAFLMGQGEGGRWLANTSALFDMSRERLENHLNDRMAKALDVLDKLATPESLNDGTAPPEAIKLYYDIVHPAIASAQDAADFLGIGDDIAPRDGRMPSHMGARAEDITPEMLKRAQQMGIAQSADELAGIFHEVDYSHVVQQMQRNGVGAKEQAQAVRWLKTTSTALGNHLSHIREGVASNSIKATMLSWNRAAARRLSEAAHFGPHLERLEQAKDLIVRDGFGHGMHLIDRVMDDIRGRLYLPTSHFEHALNDATRFMLSSSGSRHLSQLKIPIMQHGFDKVVTNAVKELAHGIWTGDIGEMHKLGVTLRHSAWEVGEHPGDMFQPRSDAEVEGLRSWVKQNFPKALHAGAELSMTGLHTFLNFGRLVAGTMAKNNFEGYWEKALRGDRNMLGLFADVFKVGDVTSEKGRAAFVEQLKGLNKEQARAHFIKTMADLEGLTYNPKDFPGWARSEQGRQTTRFRVFRWGLVHNIWNQMTSPNYTRAHRMRVALRFIASTPLSTIDPILRHVNPVSKGNLVRGGLILAASAFGVSAANIDSELAYQSWEKLLKDKSTSAAAYALTMFAVNDGALGIAGDLVQGFNMLNPDIINRAILSGNIPALAPGENLFFAGALAAHAAMSGDKKAMRRAYSQLLSDLPLGNSLARIEGARPPTRLPKKQVVKEAFEKGARAVGLH